MRRQQCADHTTRGYQGFAGCANAHPVGPRVVLAVGPGSGSAVRVFSEDAILLPSSPVHKRVAFPHALRVKCYARGGRPREAGGGLNKRGPPQVMKTRRPVRLWTPSMLPIDEGLSEQGS